MSRRTRWGFGLGSVVFLACAGQTPPAPTPPGLGPDAGGASASLVAKKCKPYAAPDVEDGGAPVEEEGERPVFRHVKPKNAKDLCETADSNLARVEAKITAPNAGPNAAATAWDHRTPPLRMDLVQRRYTLSKTERDLLGKNGFVVLAREEVMSYAWGYHDIYQSELPVWISVDSILHALYATNDAYLARIEREELVPLLAQTLSSLHCTLETTWRDYPPEVARDLDLYLTVARSLLADESVPSVLGVDAMAEPLVASAKKGEGLDGVAIFGRDRVVDWSSYLPRGHYASGERSAETSLEPYFRAAMWLSRLEMNLVSRSSRSSIQGSPDLHETPREAIVALALSDLVERAHAVTDVAKLDRTWTILAGRREDVSIGDMLALRQKAGIKKIELASFDALRNAIGDDFQRTARTHPMPEGAKVLPAIATFLGPRVVADAAAFRPLLHTEIDGRYLVHAGDVAYVLGLDHGKTYLKEDLAKFPTLGARLDQARASVNGARDVGDLYSSWLGALRAEAQKPSGAVPSFMDTRAWDDARMNSIIAGYGQIRHNYVLMAAGAYDEGGCVIPDGWVEPAPAVYERIASYTERAARVDEALHPDRPAKGGPFAELGTIARILSTISRHELDGRALTDDEKRFLSMVAEMTPGSTGGPPTYTGWYFDAFPTRERQALDAADFVADYQTSTQENKVQYAGVTAPRIGIFVVDAGGAPRIVVGPVARAYELTGELDKRYTDESVREVEASAKKDPWAASYTAPAPVAPAIAVSAQVPYEDGPRVVRFVVRAPKAIASVTFELVDHHKKPIASMTRSIATGTAVVFAMTPRAHAQGIRVRVGDWAATDLATVGDDVAIRSGGVEIETEDWQRLHK